MGRVPLVDNCLLYLCRPTEHFTQWILYVDFNSVDRGVVRYLRTRFHCEKTVNFMWKYDVTEVKERYVHTLSSCSLTTSITFHLLSGQVSAPSWWTEPLYQGWDDSLKEETVRWGVNVHSHQWGRVVVSLFINHWYGRHSIQRSFLTQTFRYVTSFRNVWNCT